MRKPLAIALRLALLLAVAMGAVVAWRYRALAEPAALAAALARSPVSALVFTLLCAAGSLVFLPRTLLALVGGLVFGLWWGALWATIGSTLGAILGFLAARYVSAGGLAAESLPRLAPALRAAERGGWRAIAIIRLLPVPHTPVNYALGLTRVELWSYSFGSLVGMLPMTLVYAQLGASGHAAMTGGRWVVPMLVAFACIGLSLLLPRLGFVRRSLRLGAD